MREISQNLQEKICAGIPFLVFSCEFCEICKNNFLVEQHGWLLLIIAASVVAKEILSKETDETKTKAYVLTWAKSVSY